MEPEHENYIVFASLFLFWNVFCLKPPLLHTIHKSSGKLKYQASKDYCLHLR